MRNTIGIFEFAVTGEAIEHQGKSLIALDANGTLEVFIKNRANDIARGWDKTRGRDFIRKLTADQFVVVRKVNIDLYI